MRRHLMLGRSGFVWVRAVVAATLAGGALLVPALPVAAVTPDPAVIAVHQNGAVFSNWMRAMPNSASSRLSCSETPG